MGGNRKAWNQGDAGINGISLPRCFPGGGFEVRRKWTRSFLATFRCGSYESMHRAAAVMGTR